MSNLSKRNSIKLPTTLLVSLLGTFALSLPVLAQSIPSPGPVPPKSNGGNGPIPGGPGGNTGGTTGGNTGGTTGGNTGGTTGGNTGGNTGSTTDGTTGGNTGGTPEPPPGPGSVKVGGEVGTPVTGLW